MESRISLSTWNQKKNIRGIKSAFDVKETINEPPEVTELKRRQALANKGK